MASRDKPESTTVATKTMEAPSSSREGRNRIGCFAADAALRVLLLAATVVSLVVMVTSQQIQQAFLPGFPFPVRATAQFTQSPAFVYYVAAMATACFYSVITALASLTVLFKPSFGTKFLLHFAFWDVVMLGIVAAATGAAGAVAFIGLNGNTHTTWTKVCPVFNTFCQHLAASIFISLAAAVLLLFLSVLSTVSLYRLAVANDY